MKKTYFIRMYHWTKRLFILNIMALLLVSSLLCIKLTHNPSDLPLPIFTNIFHFLTHDCLTFATICFKLSFISLLIIISTLMIYKIRTDSLINLGKSVIGTYRLRRLLNQDSPEPLILPTSNDGTSQTTPHNQVIRRFNHSIKNSVLDISNNRIILFIKIPKESQGQTLLREREEHIKEFVTSFYPDYIVSTFERKKYNLWLIGSKR